MKKALFAATWLLWLLAARPVAGQAFLEQLEQQLRRQLVPAGTAGASANPRGDGAEAQPPANPSPPSASQPGTAPASGPSQERGYLGIVTDDRQDRGRGVRILEVRAGGPAAKAGLQAQDLITGLGGIRVRQMSDLAAILEQAAPGGSLKFEFLRGEKPVQLDVTFGRRPDAGQDAASQAPKLPAGKQADLELVVPSFPDQPKAGPGAVAPGSPLPMLPTPTTPPPSITPAAKNAQNDQARIEALERRVKLLEDRLQELEREKSSQKK